MMSSSTVADRHCNQSLTDAARVDMAHNRCNKAALITVKVLFFINKLMALAPIRYDGATRKFRTHPVATIFSLIAFIVLAASAPFLVRASASLYGAGDVTFDSTYDQIALATLVGDMTLSTLLLGLQLWQRHKLAKFLNLLLELLDQLQSHTQNIVDKQTLLILWLKLALTLYDFVTNLPFLFMNARSIGFVNMTLYLITLCVQQIAGIFALNVLVAILLMTSFARCLEEAIQQARTTDWLDDAYIAQLISIEYSLHRVVPFFMSTFQLGIFLQLVHHILNWLANLFAMLEVFVVVNSFESNGIVYCLMVFVNMYSLIFVAQRCTDSAQRVNSAFLDMEEDFLESRPPQELSRLQQVIPLQMDFSVLGLFSLKNDFILFIVSFSVNFFVVILEFEINKYVEKQTE